MKEPLEQKSDLSARPEQGRRDRSDGSGIISEQLTPENMKAIFHMLVKYSNGISVPEEILENYPKDAQVNYEYDSVNKVWHIFVPRKRIRHIIKPDRRIIVPAG